MNIDLRFPLGLLFIVFGGLLTLFGLLTDRAVYERSLFINVNLWWGLVMLLFGDSCSLSHGKSFRLRGGAKLPRNVVLLK
jgi:hypothetical protein